MVFADSTLEPVHLSLYLCGFLLFSVTAQLIIEARREFGVGRRLDAASEHMTHCRGRQSHFYKVNNAENTEGGHLMFAVR